MGEAAQVTKTTEEIQRISKHERMLNLTNNQENANKARAVFLSPGGRKKRGAGKDSSRKSI